MKIPESGPKYSDIASSKTLKLDEEIMSLSKEYNERYLHWDDLKYRDLGGSDREAVWAVMKFLRTMTLEPIRIGRLDFTYCIPREFQRMLHEIDISISTGLMPADRVDDRRRILLSVSSMMEESIASSQLEGASTTTKLAKKLLRTNSPPKNLSQQMILNNYRAMQFVKANSSKDLTPEFIMSLHQTLTEGTLDDASSEGRFRTDDDIAVRGKYEDVTYYVPICYKDIEEDIRGLCEFVNDDTVFIHPLIKGIILHFAMAYIHPFTDGNGRLSRSLFYWYALKSGYPLVEYLAISKVIKSHRQRYDLAFLRTETDEDDLTYFIQYNLEMILEAIDLFSKYLERKLKEQGEILGTVSDYDLNLRQSEILRYMIKTREPVSVQELSVKYQSTQTTIRRDLLKMVDLGIVEPSGKDGHKQMFRHSGRKQA